MSIFAERVVRLFEEIHPLDRVPRSGYVLRGVTEVESVAAHSHFVALMALLFAEEFPERFDRVRLLTMALIHDLAEARLMDMPLLGPTPEMRAAKVAAERAIVERLLDGLPGRLAEAHAELCAGNSPEARLIKGLDKAQMMIRVMMYQREGRGRLGDFWENPANFTDYGIEPLSALFDAICARAGKERPRHLGD